MFTDTKVFSAYAVDDLVQDERGITRGDGLFIAAWFEDPPETSLRCCRSGSASSA